MRPLAIVGASDSHKETPYDDNVVWAISVVAPKLRRADMIFQLHEPHLFEPWLSETDVPVCLMRPHPDVPNAVILPARGLVGEFGRVFSSTVAWMIGYALHLGYRDIGFYGIDMARKAEYGYQRDMCFYLIGLGHSMGAQFRFANASMLNTFGSLYGDTTWLS